MRRTIVKIDEALCDGFGRCVIPCVEGAIAIVNGKAKVLKEELCDGLGYCVGLCPTGALSVEARGRFLNALGVEGLSSWAVFFP